MISLNETVVPPALNFAGNVMLQCIVNEAYTVQVIYKLHSGTGHRMFSPGTSFVKAAAWRSSGPWFDT